MAIVNQSEFGRRCGLTRGAISRAVKKGQIFREGKRINTEHPLNRAYAERALKNSGNRRDVKASKAAIKFLSRSGNLEKLVKALDGTGEQSDQLSSSMIKEGDNQNIETSVETLPKTQDLLIGKGNQLSNTGKAGRKAKGQVTTDKSGEIEGKSKGQVTTDKSGEIEGKSNNQGYNDPDKSEDWEKKSYMAWGDNKKMEAEINRAKVTKVNIELAEKMGELIRRKDVMSFWKRVMGAIQNNILTIDERLAEQVAAICGTTDPDVISEIRKKIRQETVDSMVVVKNEADEFSLLIGSSS